MYFIVIKNIKMQGNIFNYKNVYKDNDVKVARFHVVKFAKYPKPETGA